MVSMASGSAVRAAGQVYGCHVIRHPDQPTPISLSSSSSSSPSSSSVLAKWQRSRGSSMAVRAAAAAAGAEGSKSRRKGQRQQGMRCIDSVSAQHGRHTSTSGVVQSWHEVEGGSSTGNKRRRRRRGAVWTAAVGEDSGVVAAVVKDEVASALVPEGGVVATEQQLLQQGVGVTNGREGKDECSPEVIAELIAYLNKELPKLFEDGGMSADRFESKVEFEDPITRYSSIDGYLFNIQMLRYLFTPSFFLHSTYQSAPNEITTRWTMEMCFRLLPWQPNISFTGLSIYGINPSTGKFLSHKDIWDSISDNAYFSREGLQDLVQQLMRLQLPSAASWQPPTELLLRRAAYEVRSYPSLSAASAAVPEGDAVGSSSTAETAIRRIVRQLQGSVSPSGWWLWRLEGETPSRLETPLLLNATRSAPSPLSELPPASVVVAPLLEPLSAESVAAASTALRAAAKQDGLKLKGGTTVLVKQNLLSEVVPSLTMIEVWIEVEEFSFP